MAKDLSSVGINLDFAPVVDLAINKENKVIVTRGRSFGESSQIVTKYASIFVDELKKEGVISTLKHFPGHGSSLADSHLGFVDITKTWIKKSLNHTDILLKTTKQI
jgi:beta-N-acetylhexosaminidase